MCKPTTTAPRTRRGGGPTLLLTTESFHADDGATSYDCDGKGKGKGERRRSSGPAPSVASTLLTLAVLVGFLWGMELGVRWALNHFQHLHPILSVELNRHILARHIGVDVVGLACTAAVGLRNRAIVRDMIPGAIALKRSSSMPEAGYESRLFTYHPAGQQVLLFFFAYSTKNMIDSVLWNDGAIFIIHHLLSGASAWGGMYPGVAHYYAIFFMGISEVSTAILSLLANFDDEFGVQGLGDAFPLTKVVLGVVFAAAFVVCRTILWPFATYYFVRDANNAIKSDTPQSRRRRGWLRLLVVCVSGLTVLQAIWLVQIIVTMKEEVSKML